jgi:hypothetical protein
MPLTIEELRAQAAEVLTYGWAGRPEQATRVAATDVLPHLDSEDRNVRVAALRVLAWCDGPEAIDGVLRGLDDEKKRVREVAAKSSPRFLTDPRVVARLRRAAEENEPGSGRPAMEILGGMYTSTAGLSSFAPVAEALAALAEHPARRRQVLVFLLRSHQLNPDLTEILRTFVRDGTKEEAVFATRRLDGFRVERMELIDADTRAQADRAWGHLWYWVRAS